MVQFSTSQLFTAFFTLSSIPHSSLAKPIASRSSLSRRVGHAAGVVALDYVGGETGGKVGELTGARVCIYQSDPSTQCGSTPVYCTDEPLAFGVAYAFPDYDITSEPTSEDHFKNFTAARVEWGPNDNGFNIMTGPTIHDTTAWLANPQVDTQPDPNHEYDCIFALPDAPSNARQFQTFRLVYKPN